MCVYVWGVAQWTSPLDGCINHIKQRGDNDCAGWTLAHTYTHTHIGQSNVVKQSEPRQSKHSNKMAKGRRRDRGRKRGHKGGTSGTLYLNGEWWKAIQVRTNKVIHFPTNHYRSQECNYEGCRFNNNVTLMYTFLTWPGFHAQLPCDPFDNSNNITSSPHTSLLTLTERHCDRSQWGLVNTLSRSYMWKKVPIQRFLYGRRSGHRYHHG